MSWRATGGWLVFALITLIALVETARGNFGPLKVWLQMAATMVLVATIFFVIRFVWNLLSDAWQTPKR